VWLLINKIEKEKKSWMISSYISLTLSRQLPFLKKKKKKKKILEDSLSLTLPRELPLLNYFILTLKVHST
jgi:hypothetical protein